VCIIFAAFSALHINDPSKVTMFNGCDCLNHFTVFARIMPNVHRRVMHAVYTP
jgi:hypothetical protein